MNEKHLGFLIKITKLSESRLILTILTQQAGKIQGVLRIGRKASQAFLTPMTCIAFNRTGRENQHLKNLSSIDVESHVYDFASSYLGLTLLNHWSFLIDKTQPEEHPDSSVYRLLEHVLEYLRQNQTTPRSLRLTNLYFEMWLLHFSGILHRQHPNQTGEEDIAPEVRLARKLPPELFSAVYRHQLPAFLEQAENWESEAKINTSLGQLWQKFLDCDLPPRALFLNQAHHHQ